MGLAGRKQKQRIGADPRNLSWADDAAKFGQAYLSKMGWDPSKGLGTDGEGRTSHIKVVQKLNLLGIGAGQQQGADGVAWKQNREYELLLKRLNQTDDITQEYQKDAKAKDEGVTEKEEDVSKRKYDSIVEPVEGEEEDGNQSRKKSKKDKEGRKDKKDKSRKKKEEKKKERKMTEKNEADSSSETTESKPLKAPAPRPMAHRARFLRSKQLASRSSTALNEILGVSGASTPSSYPVSGSATPYPPDSVLSSRSGSPSQRVPETDQELTTSTKSVADYFKEKLAARALARSVTASPAPASFTSKDEEYTPRAGLGSRLALTNSAEEVRLGLGSSSSSAMRFGGLMGGLGFTRASNTDPTTKPVEDVSSGGQAPKEENDKVTRDNEEGIKQKKKKKKCSKSSSEKEKDVLAEEADEGSPQTKTLNISKGASDDMTPEEDTYNNDVNDDRERRRRDKEERRAKRKEKKEKKEKKKSQKEK